jgi:hypothetical protein
VTTGGGRLEELEKKIAAGVTTFLAEIDQPDGRDLFLEIADNGSILQRVIRD